MKLVATLIASLFAVSAFAADAPAKKGEPVAAKTTPNPVVAPAPEAKKEAAKPADKKAEPAKSDAKKAEPAKK